MAKEQEPGRPGQQKGRSEIRSLDEHRERQRQNAARENQPELKVQTMQRREEPVSSQPWKGKPVTSQHTGQKKASGAGLSADQKKALGNNSSVSQKKASGTSSSAGQKKTSGTGSSAGQKKASGTTSSASQVQGGKKNASPKAASQKPSGNLRPVYQKYPAQNGNPPEHARQASSGKKGKVRRFYDYSLLFTIIFLTVFGLMMIYSSSSYSAQIKFGDAGYYMKRQGLIALGGFFVMLVVSKMNYHFFAKFAILAYILSYVLMLMVMLSPLGVELNGKKRWLQLGPVQFQPTELVKIALILMLAVMITQIGTKINSVKSLLKVAAVALPIAGLVAENNLSSGIIIMGIAFVMCFVACKLQWPFLLCTVIMGLCYAFAGPIATALERMGLMHGYQLNRIYVWLEPEAYPQDGGYQVLQGLYAIGSGGLVGKGLGESIQKLGFVPEAQNDMVFSIICEELGIFGAVSLILIFMFMIYRFMLIASNAPDLFGAMLVIGVMGHIAIQVILNIAVVTNTIPNTGITLPFISYGGTSVVFLMMEMGMVLSVSNQIKLQK